MIEIINDFLSKESKMKNIILEELLQTYSVDMISFWNYVYNYDLVKNKGLADRIKLENQSRKDKRKSLELYRSLKDSKYTFGDLSNTFNISIDEIERLLKNPYLEKGIVNYSYQNLKLENLKRLHYKENFSMYFYFMEHNITFQELADIFHKSEAEVIYYFDEFLKSEFTEKEIQTIFKKNKLCMEGKSKQREHLNDYYILNEKEIQEIDNYIEAFQQKINSHTIHPILKGKGIDYLFYKNNQITQSNIETLLLIKTYLTDSSMTQKTLLQSGIIDNSYLSERFHKKWVAHLLSKSILIKLRIKAMIGNYSIYQTYDTQRFGQIDRYLKLYSEWLNQDQLTLEEFAQWKGEPLCDGHKIDQQFHTHFFSKLNEIINEIEKKQEIMLDTKSMYDYYINHFILLRDLAMTYHISQNQLEKYFSSSQMDIKSMKRIENSRQKKLRETIKQLSLLSQTLYNWNQQEDSEKFSLFSLKTLDLLEQIYGKLPLSDFNRQSSYIEKLIRCMQFTALYLWQQEYDVVELSRLFGIKTRHTACEYLHHPLVQKIIDSDLQDYILLKRNLHLIITRQNNYENLLTRNEKGQFIKK